MPDYAVIRQDNLQFQLMTVPITATNQSPHYTIAMLNYATDQNDIEENSCKTSNFPCEQGGLSIHMDLSARNPQICS